MMLKRPKGGLLGLSSLKNTALVMVLAAAYLGVRALVLRLAGAAGEETAAQPPPARPNSAAAGRAEEARVEAVETDAARDAGAPPSPERRRVLALLGVAAGGIGATLLGLPAVGFLLSPLIQDEEDAWREVGSLTGFAVGKTVKVEFLDPSPVPWSGPAARTAAWLRRVDERTFVAFAITCTHLGCPVRWEAGPRFFMCPCHGGVFDEDGEVMAGPPAQPLVRYATRVHNDRVEIRTAPVPITGNLLPDR